MRIKQASLTLAAVLAFAACGQAEPLRTKDYYQALGSEKTIQELDNCVAEKSKIIDSKDAVGADNFAKSNRNANCATAAVVQSETDGKALLDIANKMGAANSQAELKSLEASMHSTDGDWMKRLKVFPDWKDKIAPAFRKAVGVADYNKYNRSIYLGAKEMEGRLAR